MTSAYHGRSRQRYGSKLAFDFFFALNARSSSAVNAFAPASSTCTHRASSALAATPPSTRSSSPDSAQSSHSSNTACLRAATSCDILRHLPRPFEVCLHQLRGLRELLLAIQLADDDALIAR